jgi:hypothetical protein
MARQTREKQYGVYSERKVPHPTGGGDPVSLPRTIFACPLRVHTNEDEDQPVVGMGG